MNRFRKQKKVKDDSTIPRPSVESDSSSPFRMFGRKKSIEEEKKDIDLTSALPTNDDFRTSLLMTGLSARFSMLREQDDPNSKIGKASDDSVLYPKRQSRMADFGFSGGLQDIAEVESLRAPHFSRTDSYHSDDAASTNGSIMNRSKPLEGNSLFGGRQKVYKIPAGSKGGFQGRALYEDDVSQSAFQKWRQAQRENPSVGEDQLHDMLEREAPVDFSRRRETNSSISSGPSAARNSTAATSITSSQPAPSIKDWQFNGPGSSGTAPAVERSVTRTRRLYEQGLNQDLHDQQSSALSRIDTISRQRAFGSRTPDLSPNMPSPTAVSASDRVLDWRPIMAKSSAPNLRSFTPPTSGSSQAAMPELGVRLPSADQKDSFGAAPPLSPPISETGDQPGLPLQSSDRRTGTPLFNKPEQYDEAKYAQRQRQLQKGREPASFRSRGESNGSINTSRSASLSSAQGLPFERVDSAIKTEPTVQEESAGITFFDDDVSITENASITPAPQVTLERPDDHDHPALRGSASSVTQFLTPATYQETSSEPNSAPMTKSPSASSATSPTIATYPVDSPTLGPDTGLSGMVRQHLRNVSIASSFYGGADLAEAQQEHLQPRRDTSYLELTEDDWDMAHGNVDGAGRHEQLDPSGLTTNVIDVRKPEEQDEFARHLADGARRVRERLNTYVETDSRPQSPVATPSEPAKGAGSGLRTNALGILRTKSSRGSLSDNGRDSRDLNVPMPAKTLGIGAATMATSPSSTDVDAKFAANLADATALGNGKDEGESPTGQKESVHAGLKAFRQARRELQKMKELELEQRRQAPAQPSDPPPPPPVQTEAQSPVAKDRPFPQRAQSLERRPAPVLYSRPPRVESRNGDNSRSASRATSDRDRSGSDTSNGGQPYSRGPRMRNGPTSPNHGLQVHVPTGAPNGSSRDGPMHRSPGLPGTDIKRSPIMPPHPYPGKAAPHSPYGRPDPAQGLSMHPPAFPHDSGARSPISPHTGRMYPNGNGPMQSGPVPPRMPRGRDVSDTAMFGPSTDPGPTGNYYDGQSSTQVRHGGLPGPAASTPDLHGTSSAPPLPPINPRRRTARGLPPSEDSSGIPMMPTSPGSRDRSPAPLYMSEDEGGPESYRQRLRKVTSDANVAVSRARRGTRDEPRTPMF